MIQLSSETIVLTPEFLLAAIRQCGVHATEDELTVHFVTDDDECTMPATECRIAIGVLRERTHVAALPVPACHRRAA